MTHPRHHLAALATAIALTFGFAACGDDPSADASDASPAPLVVSAAASLKAAFTVYGAEFDEAKVRLSFAGSDALAAQIRQGTQPDVFASANTKLQDALFKEGLVERPQVFAGNRLVLAVPSTDAKVESLADLRGDGIKLAIGSDSVPIGAYTDKVLDRLPAAESKAILANVRSEEPDVKGIIGKLTQGVVDAGFVYITDVKATDGALTAIELPAAVKPSAAYGVAVVKGGKNPKAASAFIAGLISGEGQAALRAAGFESPPK